MGLAGPAGSCWLWLVLMGLFGLEEKFIPDGSGWSCWVWLGLAGSDCLASAWVWLDWKKEADPEGSDDRSSAESEGTPLCDGCS